MRVNISIVYYFIYNITINLCAFIYVLCKFLVLYSLIFNKAYDQLLTNFDFFYLKIIIILIYLYFIIFFI
jgi:hypothetical protein